MTDIVDRLRAVAALADFEADAVIIRNGADEIVSLREAIRRLAEQDATLSVREGSVTVTMDATLTDEEREAVRFCTTAALPETQKLGGVAGELCRLHAATLRGLLERLK